MNNQTNSVAPRKAIHPLREQISTHGGPVLLWTLLWGLFFLTLLLGQERLPSSDFSGQYHAFGVFQAQEMSQGRLPLWSPGSYGGFPFAADTQAAVIYPLRWLTILLSLPWGFSYYALELEALAHIWLAGFFTYALSYQMTRQPWAALVSAVAFGLSGYLTSFPLLQVTILETLTWLPLVLLLLRMGVVENRLNRSLKYLVGAGLVLGVSFLAGHPQAFLYIVYMTAAYYLFLILQARWNWRWVIGLGLLVGGIAAGLAAVSLLPAAHLTTYATRSDVGYDFVSSGLPMLDYLQLLVPGSLSFWVPEYVGLAAFVLALCAWFGRKCTRIGKKEIVFWGGTAVVAAWVAMGDAGVLFQLVYRIAPGFSLFRQQERLLVLMCLALAILAGQGAALWFQLEAEHRRRLLLKSGIVVAAGLGLAAVILLVGSPLFRPDWSTIWVRQAALLIPIFYLLGVTQPRRRNMMMLILFLGLDLYAATYEGLDREAGAPDVYWPEPAWFQDFQAELANQPLSRIDSRNLFHTNLGPIHNLEDMHGISPLKLSWLADFERLPQARRMELMGVSHILAYEQPETPATLVGEINEELIPGRPIQANIYQVDNYLPRAWMSFLPRLVDNEEVAWAVLADPAFDPATEVVLHSSEPQIEAINSPDTLPVVETIRPSANSLEITVETAAPGLLVISEWRYPGWQATLDRQPVELYPADYALQAVFVPAGEHMIRLQFRPLDVLVGGIISVLTLVGVGVFVFGRRPSFVNRTIAIHQKPMPVPSLPALRSRLAAIRPPDAILLMLIPIILLAFGLRVHNLGLQELRADEAVSYAFTTMSLPDVLPALIETADIHSPLPHLLLNIWVDLTGESEFALRFLSLIPAVLSVPLLFVLGWYFAGKGPCLLFVFWMAISQSLVWLGQDVRNHYTLAILFLTLATILLFRVEERPGWRRWTVYGLACVLALYSHYFSFFVLLAHGLYLLVGPARRARFWHWLEAWGIAAVLYLPWFAATLAKGYWQLDRPEAPRLARFLTAAGQELTVGPAFDNSLSVWLFLMAAIVALFGWRRLWQKRLGQAVKLGGWIAIATLGIFLVILRRPTFNPFYIAIVAPAWWMLVSLGLVGLWRRRGTGGQWLALFGGVALLGVSVLGLGRYYSEPFTYGRSTGIRSLAAHIKDQWQSNDIIVTDMSEPSIAYYLREIKPRPQIVQLLSLPADQQEIEATISNIIEENGRIWFIDNINGTTSAEQAAFQWLDYHTLLEQRLSFGEQVVFAFRPSHAVAEVMKPVGAGLKDSLVLAGYYVTLNGRPLEAADVIPVQPGDELAVTLIWECLEPISENYTVFAHLLGEDGALIAQHDGTPLFGTRPTTTWEPGERLLDRHVIEIPEGAGGMNGRLVAGMYMVDESGTVIRQLFNDRQDAIWLR